MEPVVWQWGTEVGENDGVEAKPTEIGDGYVP